MNAEYYRIGVIVRTHGVHGAVKLDSLTDDSRRFRGLKEAFLGTSGDRAQARRKVAELIREIDACVSLLNE